DAIQEAIEFVLQGKYREPSLDLHSIPSLAFTEFLHTRLEEEVEKADPNLINMDMTVSLVNAPSPAELKRRHRPREPVMEVVSAVHDEYDQDIAQRVFGLRVFAWAIDLFIVCMFAALPQFIFIKQGWVNLGLPLLWVLLVAYFLYWEG